ncbi:MAG: hypothetical protein DRN30_05970 [Thermoplasmata archaeon]|nr:MAG: hypothetical protein DRN30_05970 [Thermoplasmata archaeon]
MITRLEGKFEYVLPSLGDHKALARKIQQILEGSGYRTELKDIKNRRIVFASVNERRNIFVPEIIDGNMNGFLDTFYDIVDDLKKAYVNEVFLVFNRPPMLQVVRYIERLRKVLKVNVYPAYFDVDKEGGGKIVISRSSSWTKDVRIIAPENGQKVFVSTYRATITAEAVFEYIYHVLGIRTVSDVKLIARQWDLNEDDFLRIMLRAAREKGYVVIRDTGEIVPPWEKHIVRISLQR